MRRKVKQPAKVTMKTFTLGGFVYEVPAEEWCTCEKPEGGFTKRDDGCWVRPCCMRRTKQMFDKYGDQPVPPIVPTREQDGATT